MSRTDRTRAAIAEAARSTIAAGGISALTMTAVADASGLARATVYNHVRDRSELLALVGQSLHLEARELAAGATALNGLLAAFAHWVADDPAIAGLRAHDPSVLVSAAAEVLALGDDWAGFAIDALGRLGAHADLTAVESVTRWVASYALAPGDFATRVASAEILAQALTLDASR